jgi:hypothetical protein
MQTCRGEAPKLSCAFRPVNTARQEIIDSSGLIVRSFGSLAPANLFAHSDTPLSPVRRIRLNLASLGDSVMLIVSWINNLELIVANF